MPARWKRGFAAPEVQVMIGPVADRAPLPPAPPPYVTEKASPSLLIPIAHVCVTAATAAITLNGIRLLPWMTLADLLLAVGTLCLVLGTPFWRVLPHTVPAWLAVAAMGILVSGVLSAMRAAEHVDHLLPAIRFTVVLLVLPVLLRLVATSIERHRLLVDAWIASASLNALVAVTDATGLTNVGPTLVGIAFAGRESGLTVHPNHLAIVAAMVLPVALARAATVRGRVGSALVAASVSALALGIAVSGSRAGLVAALVAAGVTVLVAVGPGRGSSAASSPRP